MNGDLATFKIDDGYLQVNNNKWVNVNIERLLELVDYQEDATQGWIINDEGIFWYKMDFIQIVLVLVLVVMIQGIEFIWVKKMVVNL